MAAIPPQLVGESPEFLTLLDWVSDVASLNRPVLIIGERGTGKELIASRLHFLSPRWEQTYHYINCAAHDRDTFEWILYGGEGLDALLSRVNNGTLFLDNVNALSKTSQERLVRVIEYKEYDGMDGRGEQAVDIRFIASMSDDPNEAVKKGQISQDFLDRVATDTIHLPPLRVRKEDIASLSLHFGRKMVASLGGERFPGFTPEAIEAMMAYDWPGNVRELKNTVDRSVSRAFLINEALPEPIGSVIFDVLTSPWGEAVPNDVKTQTLLHATPDPVEPQQAVNFADRVLAFERTIIDQALDTHNHHQGKAAESLQLSYHQFRGLLRKHGLKK